MTPADPITRGRHALVLAAGQGVRFGGGKMLAPWRGEPLVLAAVRAALAAPVERVTAVVGAEGDAVAAALGGLAPARLRIVPAVDWRDGLSASLRVGVRSLPADAESLVLFLGDMPAIPQGLAARLLDAVAAGAPAAIVASPWGPAHPVAFARAAFADLLALEGDRGARALLERLGPAVVRIESDDPGVVFDVDAPADLPRGDEGGPR